jgi:hypothetical protein
MGKPGGGEQHAGERRLAAGRGDDERERRRESLVGRARSCRGEQVAPELAAA